MQPLRSLLPSVQKRTRWIPAEKVPRGIEIWTRSIGRNEVVLDVDAKPWRRVYDAHEPVDAALAELRVPHLTAWSGGKGAHSHVLLDGLTLPSDLFDAAKRLRVDAWREARFVCAEALLNAAGVPTGRKRWAPPYGSGVFDRSKIWWRSDRAGSMVRAFGYQRIPGFRKTLAPAFSEWPRDEPPASPRLRLPRGEWPAWRVPAAINDRVVEAVRLAVAKAENARRVGEGAPKVRAGATLADVPCAYRFVREGSPAGSRHYNFLNLVVTCKALGYSRATTDRFVLRALRACGLPTTDPAREIVAWVFDPQYGTPNLSCPSPHTALCEGARNRCAFTRGGFFFRLRASTPST